MISNIITALGNFFGFLSILILTFGIIFYLILDVLLRMNLVIPFFKLSIKKAFTKIGFVLLILSTLTSLIILFININVHSYSLVHLSKPPFGTAIAIILVKWIFESIDKIYASTPKKSFLFLKLLVGVMGFIFVFTFALLGTMQNDPIFQFEEFLGLNTLIFASSLIIFEDTIQRLMTES